MNETFTPSSYAKTWATYKYVTKDDQKNYDKFVALFVEEFQKYTPCWITNTKLKAIYLVKNLKINVDD